MHEIYTADYCFITTERCMDIYPRDEKVEYLGAIATQCSADNALHWPSNTLFNIKIFVYIKSNYHHLDDLLSVIKASPAKFIVYSVGLSNSRKKQFSSHNILFSDEPCNIERLQKECHGAIIHGGNLIDQFVSVGIPLLLLPLQVENLMMSEKVLKEKAGISFYGPSNKNIITEKVKLLITDPALKKNARLLSKRMAVLPLNQQLNRVTKVVSRLLRL